MTAGLAWALVLALPAAAEGAALVVRAPSAMVADGSTRTCVHVTVESEAEPEADGSAPQTGEGEAGLEPSKDAPQTAAAESGVDGAQPGRRLQAGKLSRFFVPIHADFARIGTKNGRADPKPVTGRTGGRGLPAESTAGGALRGLKLEASAGQLREVRPGSGDYELTAPRLARGGTLRLTARAPGFLSVTADIALRPVPFAGGEATSSGPVGIAGPARLLLASGEPVAFRLTRWQGERPPRLYVSAGRIGEARRGPDGVWRADFLPPLASYPRHLLIAAASEAGELLDWTSLPLYGAGQLAALAEPGVWVKVRVDGEEFGPVLTDAKGAARLSIFAPPSPREAETLGRDAVGNQTRHALELAVPRSSRALALCTAAREVVMLAVDAEGRPRSGATVLVEASDLRLRAKERSPGVYAATPAPPRSSGDVSFARAWLADDPGSDGECRWPAEDADEVGEGAPRFSAGARAGAGTAVGRLFAPFAFVDVGLHPRSGRGRLAVGLEAGYGSSPGQPLWAATAQARASYRLMARPLPAYVGASAGALWFSDGQNARPALAVGAFAGLEQPVPGGALTLEAGVLFSRPADPELPGGLGLAFVSAGYRFGL